jgi:hypothetical protein
MIVIWPNQSFQLLTNLQANNQITLKQKNASGVFDYQQFFPNPQKKFTDITAAVGMQWQHKENLFSDFNDQYFIPHMLSTAGPRVAVADVNGDGLDDIYVCGARFQPGALFTQTASGHFIQANIPAFKQDSLCEDVDALFFDANNDGHLDLYVVSGGNEYFGGAPQLADRLFLNDGKGNFIKSTTLPALLENKSTVCAADIDHDGDMDLFVGGRVVAGAYGIIPTSYMLLNDGKGNFSIAGDDIAPGLKKIGMVTSASFADVNIDGQPDLVVAGEFMPVTVFINDKGKLIKQQTPAAEQGLWQSVYITDVDGDGNLDIIAGNYGTNSKLHASKDDPLRMYVKDMDNNGRVDQLLTCSVSGKEYTFFNKDDIERLLPIIKKSFSRNDEFAGKTVQEAFGNLLDGAQILTAETLRSVVLKNDGKGSFTPIALPQEMQESPVFAFFNSGTALLSGGNLYGVLPYEGRYDASWGNCLLQVAGGAYKWLSPVNSGFMVRGEIRDIKPIKLAGYKHAFVVGINNAPLTFFAY